jgi:hypothetical protein
VGIGRVEITLLVRFVRRYRRRAAAERLVRPDVAEDVAAHGDVREVDDHVGPLGEAHQEAVAVSRGEIDRRCEEPALVADLPDLDSRDGVEVEDQEP